MLLNALKFAVVLAALLIVGCRTGGIYNVQGAPVTGTKAIALQDVEMAIRRAGAGLGWQIVPRGAGHAEGILVLRNHRAVVDITYDTKTYNIKYKDSTNLDYDGTSIHSNYNGWVQNLDKAIRTQLSLL